MNDYLEPTTSDLILDLVPVLEKEKLLLVEEDEAVTERTMILDLRKVEKVSAEPLKLVITHQIITPINLVTNIRVYVNQTHTVQLYYEQQIMANNVTSTIRVKGVVRDQARLQFDSLMKPMNDHQRELHLRCEKKFTLLEQGSVFSRPELASLQTGMRASHGLTISGLEAQPLYFVQSRGLPLSQAENLLLQV